jgi:hypothetical protein
MLHGPVGNPTPPKYEYPGLGLPLRHYDDREYPYYPIGAHNNCHGSESQLIAVRELAMMDIMEKLTDKEDWNKKVFDDGIVAKWREEALAVPDSYFWDLAVYSKSEYWRYDNGQLELDDDYDFACQLEGIMDEPTFEVVRCVLFNFCIRC